MQKNLLVKIIVIVNLVLMGVLMLFAVKDDSPTSDEPPHILSGYVALRYGHDYIDIEHPLLAKMVLATPLLFQDLKVDLSDPNYTIQKKELDIGKMFDASRSFLNYQDNNPDQILLSTRIPTIIMTMLFGIVVFLLTKNLFGDLAAMIAVFLYSTESVIISNGSLFNTDLPAAGFILLTIFALLLYSYRQSKKRLFFLIVAISAAFLSKFSTLFLLPIVLLLMELIYRRQKVRPRSHMIYLVGGASLSISLFYGLVSLRDRGVVGFLPLRYLEGVHKVFSSVSVEGRDSYLLGENYTGGRWYYFPILILTKTQILTLIGFILALILIYIKKIHLTKQVLLITLFPVTVYLLYALTSKFNIGLRHVLPIYPFLIIFAAAGFATLIHLLQKNLSGKLSLLTVVLVLAVIFGGRIWSVATTYPHFLSYYNILGGSTDNGWKIASDANYDWGQDVKRLADYVRNNKIKSIALDNFSGNYAATDYYKIPLIRMYPDKKNYKGYVALSTSVITFYKNQKDNYNWIVDNYKIIGKAGKSIFIFKIN